MARSAAYAARIPSTDAPASTIIIIISSLSLLSNLYIENVLRLPLIPMSAAHREMLMGLMQAQGLNVE